MGEVITKVEVGDGAVVPEMLKLKIEKETKLAEEKAVALEEKAKRDEENKLALIERTKGYYKEYADNKKNLINLRREAKLAGNFFVEPEAKLIFCVRLKGILKIAPKPRKILQLFRLRQINNGVFLKVNKPILNMLQLINPYVAYGYPDLKTTRMMLYKRGFAKINKERIPITDNRYISENLGELGIHGMEDLVHEIYTVGPNFKKANNFLWPFKLHAPKGGWTRKRAGYTEMRGGDWGNREDDINHLLRKMMV